MAESINIASNFIQNIIDDDLKQEQIVIYQRL